MNKRPEPAPSPWQALHTNATQAIAEQGSDREPTLTDLLMAHLGFTHPDDGLWLCRDGCGVTRDHECDYGGWHGTGDSEAVQLRTVEDESGEW